MQPSLERVGDVRAEPAGVPVDDPGAQGPRRTPTRARSVPKGRSRNTSEPSGNGETVATQGGGQRGRRLE